MATKASLKKSGKKMFLEGKTVLVTGGTGTFGRAFVSRLLKDKGVSKIIIFSRDELKQSEMQHQYAGEKRLRFFIGDIRDKDRLVRAFDGVDIVVHAAALKQVPATEYNPFEAIKTNVIGSKNVIDAAIDCNVEKAILISSDKAVEPINLYGATKMCAEKLFVAANVYSGPRSTRFSVVRYGNVIGSRGSLVEFIERHRATGLLKLTDERMTRFWIRIEDVMEVILECTSAMRGGEIFIPKMQNMPVGDVIRMLAPECKIEIVGIRPGEKLHETLLTKYEAPRTRELPHVYAIMPEFGGDAAWLTAYKPVPEQFVYTSDDKRFLMTKKEAARLFMRS
jgi:UDP-N-acetylglucosamine 4,6-dehydratase